VLLNIVKFIHTDALFVSYRVLEVVVTPGVTSTYKPRVQYPVPDSLAHHPGTLT